MSQFCILEGKDWLTGFISESTWGPSEMPVGRVTWYKHGHWDLPSLNGPPKYIFPMYLGWSLIITTH